MTTIHHYCLTIKFCCALLTCIVITFPAIPSFAESKPHTYEFGVLPYLAPLRLEEAYQPITREFSRILQRRVLLRTDTSSVDYFSNLGKAKYDITLVNPFDSIAAIDQFGYEPLAARPLHHCNIYIRSDSPITRVEELKHKLLGVASPRSPITFYTKRILTKHQLIPDTELTIKNFPTPQACLHSLVIQEIDACGGGSASAANFMAARGIELRTLAKCEEFPGMVLLVHSRVSNDQKQLLRKTILDWPATPQGQQFIQATGPHAVFVPYVAETYANIRRDYQEWTTQ